MNKEELIEAGRGRWGYDYGKIDYKNPKKREPWTKADYAAAIGLPLATVGIIGGSTILANKYWKWKDKNEKSTMLGPGDATPTPRPNVPLTSQQRADIVAQADVADAEAAHQDADLSRARRDYYAANDNPFILGSSVSGIGNHPSVRPVLEDLHRRYKESADNRFMQDTQAYKAHDRANRPLIEEIQERENRLRALRSRHRRTPSPEEEAAYREEERTIARLHRGRHAPPHFSRPVPEDHEEKMRQSLDEILETNDGRELIDRAFKEPAHYSRIQSHPEFESLKQIPGASPMLEENEAYRSFKSLTNPFVEQGIATPDDFRRAPEPLNQPLAPNYNPMEGQPNSVDPGQWPQGFTQAEIQRYGIERRPPQSFEELVSRKYLGLRVHQGFDQIPGALEYRRSGPIPSYDLRRMLLDRDVFRGIRNSPDWDNFLRMGDGMYSSVFRDLNRYHVFNHKIEKAARLHGVRPRPMPSDHGIRPSQVDRVRHVDSPLIAGAPPLEPEIFDSGPEVELEPQEGQFPTNPDVQ